MKHRALTLRGTIRRRAARLIFMAAIVGAIPFSETTPVWAQPAAAVENSKRDADEKDDCVRNLKLIFAAIQAYKFDHKDLPNWLSDLVPQYLADTSVLICPVTKRTGDIEISTLADPKVPSSYVYQFSPVSVSKNNPNWTWRDWKRRQMGLAGSSVPLVCCQHHGVVLNLGFDGKIYESSGPWESLLTNHVNIADLTAEAIFGGGATISPAAPPVATESRDRLSHDSGYSLARPSSRLLLSPSSLATSNYNAHLTDSWLRGWASNNNLAALTPGTQILAGVMFDTRGLIQLAGKRESSKHFPTNVAGIRVQQKCQRLHFLHASAFGNSDNNDGLHEIGYYVIHFADKKDANIPIIFSRDVRDWWHTRPNESAGDTELTVAWTGTNAASTVPLSAPDAAIVYLSVGQPHAGCPNRHR